MSGFTRRVFLSGSGAIVVGSTLRCGSTTTAPAGLTPEPEPEDGAQLVSRRPEAITHDDAVFGRGVQAGELTATSALLWSHTETPGAKQLWVWREADAPDQIKLVREIEVSPEDGFLRAEVDGLGPGHYVYAFVEPGADGPQARSVVGRFRTAFAADDARPLRLGGLTCSSLRNRPFVALEAFPEEAVDLYCHLGDMSYNDGARTLETFREKWRETLSEPGYIATYASAGLVATWDDHEVDNDYDPEALAVEDPEKLAAAKRAYFETLAIRRLPEDRLWRSHRWGTTAEIFVVDSRSERRPSTRRTAQAQYLSRAQMDWLKDGLAQSPCRYKVVLNSVPMTRLPGLWGLAASDRWQGYEAQRNELLEHLIAADLRDVLFLSGDFHCGFVGRLEPEGEGRRFWEIAVGPTANGPNPLPVLVELGDLQRADVFPEEQFIYFSSTTMATTTVDLDPQAGTVRVRYVDRVPERAGQVLFDDVLPA